MFPEGRLFDFLIVGVIALIVVGPKDLPLLMRRVGQFMARVRAMAAEFRASFDELARQSELDELRREVEALRAAQPLDYAAGQIGGDEVLADIHEHLTDANRELTAPITAPPPAAAAEPSPPEAATPPPTTADPKPEPTPQTASGSEKAAQ